MLHIVGAVVVVLVLPALVIDAFVGKLGVSAMFTGVLLGAVGAKLGGTHRMLYVAPALGVVAGCGRPRRPLGHQVPKRPKRWPASTLVATEITRSG